MLEGLAAWVLNTYVGEYVENLNTDQLSIALLQGAVELDNLPLKKDALKSLDLPLEIKSGFIGKITLHIPMRRMRSEPWVISMEKLYLVAGPLRRTQYSVELEKANEMAQKEAMLKALEDKWQVQGEDTSSSSWFAYGTSLASNILENLQLKVKEVHLRYEDGELIPSCPFACGVVIKSLSAQSTDGQWIPKFVSRATADMMRKLVDLQNFSVYMDTDAVMLGGLPREKLMKALESDKYQTSSTKVLKGHDYILSPVSAQAKMTRNTSQLPLRSTKNPRITLDILLEQIPVSLSEVQYRGFVVWLREFERHDKQRKYRKWKPTCSVKKRPREWWKFAIGVHHHQIKERNRRATWKYVLKRARENVLYHKAYIRQLNGEYVDGKQKLLMTKMEGELSFEELKILRELTYEKLKEQNMDEEERTEHEEKKATASTTSLPAPKQESPQESWGLFQGWFPGWGGWYTRGSQSSSTAEHRPRAQSVGEPPPHSDLEIEQEIRGVIQNSEEDNTLLRRDAVFAVLNFTLKSGSFSLKASDFKAGTTSGSQSILEMECTAITSTVVSRPRTGALKFDISVGGLYLRDRMTKGTIFNTLVAPQTVDRGQNRPMFNVQRPMSTSSHSPGLGLLNSISKPDDGKLFQLSWERKPPGTDAYYRLSMQTKPFDIVYNPAAAKRVSDFFTNPNKLGMASNPSALQLTAAARTRIQKMKEQTKVELRHTLDSLMEGETKPTHKWEVNLDISAPQFIIPENFCDSNSNMVVLDLGNLRFHNSAPKPEPAIPWESTDEDQASEDDFMTPLSTPPNERADEAGSQKTKATPAPDFSQLQDLSETALHQRLYEKYILELSDLQVLVGRAKDNWRHAYFKGTSHLHMIDRFSISLLLERRLLFTTDPRWPSATLSGTLPTLTVHINEQKVQALRTCMLLVTGDRKPSTTASPSTDSSPTTSGPSKGAAANQSSTSRLPSGSSIGGAGEGTEHDLVEQSRWLMMQFNIREASLQIESRGKAIAELQVGGVRATLTKRFDTTSVFFTVHSLLVVDAVQTFGPDFEPLVASHKHLCLDSRSGSMRDSDHNSPVSPQSPHSPQESPQAPFSSNTSLQAMQAALTSTFQSLVNSRGSSDVGHRTIPSPQGSGAPFSHPMSPIPDSEALITLDIEIISPNSPDNPPGECGLQIANIHFNNLDVIANQETVVEILGFFKRIMPGETAATGGVSSKNVASEGGAKTTTEQVQTRTEVTADFNKLNILLMRVVENRGDKKARKVATATLSSAKIQSTIDEHLYVEGSLGGLQFLDVTPEGRKYQKVFSVGHDPNPHGSYRFTLAPRPDMYQTAPESFTPSMSRIYQSDPRAFTFTLNRPGRGPSPEPSEPVSPTKQCNTSGVNCNTVEVNLKMASLCYTHCPRLLNEMSQCAFEFQDYMARLAASLRYAATEVAMGIVHKRSDINTSLYGSSSSLDALPVGRRKGDLSLGRDSFSLDDNAEIQPPMSPPLNIIIDARLESPVIVLPRTPQSSEALVSHLGTITIRNSNLCSLDDGEDSLNMPNECLLSEANKDRIYIEFQNMNLYSVNVDQDVFLDSSREAWGHGKSSDTGRGTQKHNIPIIYDTTIECSIDMIEPDYTIINPNVTQDFLLDEDLLPRTHDSIQIENIESVMLVNACIATPLNLVVSKRVYEQILESMDNLTFEDDVLSPQESRSLGVIMEESPRVESSMSALKLDGIDLSSVPFESFQAQLEETQQADRPLIIRARFDVPEFNVEMRGDFGEGEQGLVNLKLQKFSMNYEKNNPYSTKFDLALTTLVMEDLLQEANSKHRLLMMSSIPDETQDAQMKPQMFLSTSCPDSTIISPTPKMPSSLPSSFHEHQQNVFTVHQQKSKLVNLGTFLSFGKKISSQREDCPLTPPPSPLFSRQRSREDSPEHALVHISVVLIDKKSPEYISEFNRTNHFVMVDFNCLDMTVNLQTWVVLLDFLGMGAEIHDASSPVERRMDNQDSDVLPASEDNKDMTDDVVNTEVDLSVKSLSLTLNKPEYELAKASVSRLTAHMAMRDENMMVKGQLGSISLRDQSPQGNLYRERFMTVGQHALHFDFFKYGLPDPNLEREYDISLKLRMASVRYVHTNRFQAETLAFCQHFLQLQDVLGRMRAASAGKKVSETASIQTRLLLDMQADTPVILVPHSSRSTDILVMDLGNLTLTNKFLFDGDQGTIKFMASSGTDTSTPSHASSPGDVVKILAQPTDSSLLSGSQYAQGMTQSIFDECFPPQMGVDPMTSSIYGSLEQDYRSEDPKTGSANGAVYDPTDQSAADEGAGPSVACASSQLGSMSTDLTQSSSSSASPTRPVTAQQRRLFQGGERTLSSYRSGSLSSHVCLLDVMTLLLSDMDLFSAERVDKHLYEGKLSQDMEFPSCVVKRVGGNLLREKCALNLQVERNLEGDISHAVPDYCVKGTLTSVQFSLDLTQYKLVRGILDHNLGEPLEEFQRPLMSHLKDPKIQTVLSGDMYKCISMVIDLNDVTVELLTAHLQTAHHTEDSLAKLSFIRSRLSFESYSDQSRDVDLVSHEIAVTDTRFINVPKNKQQNVFANVLKPSDHRPIPGRMQMELHYHSTKDFSRFTALLNNMRLMCIVDWLLSVQTFLLTTADDPFETVESKTPEKNQFARSQSGSKASPRPGKSRSPLTGGIVTKRGPYIEQAPFELRMNVMDTEFVVVEDMTVCDTSAIILKCTAVMSYKPKAKERPLSCILQSLEVFSCSLGAEEETALSIIDPMTVSIELNTHPVPKPQKSVSSGLLDVTQDLEKPLLLEVSFNTMNIRLSYHDLKLFLSILNTLPKLADKAKDPGASQQAYTDKTIQHLHSLGFHPADCERALLATDGCISDAAIWLTGHATPLPLTPAPEKPKDELDITALELKPTSICICFIDDCQDADVPLAEISFNGITFYQSFGSKKCGKAMFQVMGDYYNRALSGWEPFVEPWRCKADWEQVDNKLDVVISATEVLNFNLTSTLIDQYSKIKSVWTEDYYQVTASLKESSSLPGGKLSPTQSPGSPTSDCLKARVPFVPFTLKNETGSTLWFLTVTTTPSNVPSGNRPQKLDNTYIQATNWKMVNPGQQVPFFIQDREKMRHKNSHELLLHQLVVKVDGWQRIPPVSVDKVGVYFRHAAVEIKSTNKQVSYMSPARIVFDVQQEGSAKKVVTVRSALMLVNQLSSTVNVRMENFHTNDNGFTMLEIPVNGKVPIPLRHVPSRLWIKPSDWPVEFCDRAIHWNHVTKAGETHNSVRICRLPASNTPYRFCVAVKRENYPEDSKTCQQTHMLPGHTISLQPTIVLINLLPIELNYYMRDTDISGSIKSGKEAALLTADPSQHQHLGILLENFPMCRELNILPGTSQYKVKLTLHDTENKLLELTVRLAASKGGSLRVSVSAPYWLVNRCGLPLVFKQDCSSSLAAGQFMEHELGCSVSPLLFSYTEKEYPFLCTMRVGTFVHGAEGYPNWCQGFSLESGSGLRQLHVMHRPSSQPVGLVAANVTLERLMPSVVYARARQQVYNIGIDVQQGKGRFRDTHIITFAPRYEIDNRSRHKLAISQRHLAMGKQDSKNFLLSWPNCKLPYHWPRLDLDQLLCVRLADQPNCMWSGGFTIDRVDSFHVMLRSFDGGTPVLLRVEILLEGSTFFIVFTDSEEFPPPFRIDNCSEVPVVFYQSEIANEVLKTSVREHTSFNYSWDEPTLPPLITVRVQGGTSATYSMNTLGEGEQLCYQNFIYLAATATFPEGFAHPAERPGDLSQRTLVLDVQHNSHVAFRKKEQGKRSQLWRMTSKGLLEHEGSTPPHDPSNPSRVTRALVLDIADIAAQPEMILPLVLKKPDERRRSTQTWSFSEDGRLCCSSGDLTVQAIAGVDGLQDGAIAVIGPYPKKTESVPLHMLISRQCLRPGSGCLAVHILMDGPTRVLQISDIQSAKKLNNSDGDRLLCGDDMKALSVEKSDQDKGDNQRDLCLTLNLKGGLGISLVNNVPEELIYISLQDIQLIHTSTPADAVFAVTVANTQYTPEYFTYMTTASITMGGNWAEPGENSRPSTGCRQTFPCMAREGVEYEVLLSVLLPIYEPVIDSQMLGSQRQVLLYVTPQNSEDALDNTPALHITAHKVHSTKWNAEIFRHLIVSMKKLTVQLEERVLWRLLQFVGYNQSDPELQHPEESEVGSHKIVMAATSVRAKRYYFAFLKINISGLALSMITASKLPSDLQAIKTAMAMLLVKFEEAKVDLGPYVRHHSFETTTFLVSEMKRHYIQELKWQAAKILGSVDFLGNPLGLFNDVAEGISGLIKDGNLGGLVKNVAHGVSNSAAKVTGSLSDGLGTVTMDDKHNQTREQIKEQHSNSGGGHLVAGIKGLGYGLIGGLTSIVSQTYEGTREDGIEGFFTGLGKGMVGTVTKPVAGVLDFASEAASAVRDVSKSKFHDQPKRIRERRCCLGPDGLLPVYSTHHAKNQKFLYDLNENNFQELYITVELLRCSDQDGLHALISSEQVYFLKKGGPDTDNIVFKAKYKDLQQCRSVAIDTDGMTRYYVELIMHSSSSSGSARQNSGQPQVRCDKEKIAQKVAQQIMYAKSLYDERTHTLVMDPSFDDMDQ